MKTLRYKFVDVIPESTEIEEGTIYISIKYCTAVHKCVCGCGNEVVTPISPTDWKIIFNGETVSLSPSIGNWNFDCQSHYWITNNEISFSRLWSKSEIEKGRKKDHKKKRLFFSKYQKNKKQP